MSLGLYGDSNQNQPIQNDGINVTQYGWTDQEIQGVTLIMDYLKKAQDLYEQSKILEISVKDLILQLADLKALSDSIKVMYDDFLLKYPKLQETLDTVNQQVLHIESVAKSVEDVKNEVSTLHLDVYQMKVSIEQTYTTIQGILADVTDKSQQVTNDKNTVATNLVEVRLLYNECKKLVEELRTGQVYRGTWNPNSSAWPPHLGTNSVWDVVLNKGQTEVTWNGIKWIWGDRLLYVLSSTSYEQIESGIGVLSVNSKAGFVTLTATDVGALPDAQTVGINRGNILNNQSFGVGFITSKDDGQPWIGTYVGTVGGDKVVSGTHGGGATMGGHNSDMTSWSDFYINTLKTSGNPFKTYIGNPYAKLETGLSYKIYHEGFKPTITDLGAAPSGYGLGEASPGVVGGSLNTLRYNGWRTYNADGGDTGGPARYGTCMDFGHVGNASTYKGWAGQLFLSNFGSLHLRVNETAGSFNGSKWEQVYTTSNPPLNDAGTYDAQPRDFNTLEAGFSGLIVISGSSNIPPPSTWGEGHVYVEVKRVLGGEIVQRTLPFRNSETTASRVRQSNGIWTEWKVDLVVRHIGSGADLNNYFNSHNFGSYSVDGSNTANWPWNNVSAGTLVVDGIHGYTRQQAWRADTFDTLVRLREGAGPWSAWNSVYNSTYFPKRANWSNFGETKDMTVGGLAWTNYGNNHSIIDVSKGVTPDGAPTNNTNSGFPWGPNHPTLVGWNGSNTYGVRVDSARVADTVKNNGIVADGNGNAWSIINGNIVEFGGFVGCHNSAPQRVNFPFPLATVFTVQITPYTEGSGRNSGSEANNVVDLIDNNGFTIHSGQGKSPCTFMWMAKGIRA